MTTELTRSYVSFDERLQAVADNLVGSLRGKLVRTMPAGGARRSKASQVVETRLLGWGVTSEAEINPQSTAEALTTLVAVQTRLGTPPALDRDQLAEVVTTLTLTRVPGDEGTPDRSYASVVDWAWRIRGLLAARTQEPELVPDEMLRDARTALLEWFNPQVGGFTINRGDQDCSVFATGLALEALLALEHDALISPDDTASRAGDGAVKYLRGKLKSAMAGASEDGTSTVHVYRIAYPLRALAVRALHRGKHGPDEPTVIAAIDWLKARVLRNDFPAVEDSLLDRRSVDGSSVPTRGGYESPSVWQHLCLPLALEAILVGDGSLDQQAPANAKRRIRRRALTHPSVQLALVALGDLQEPFIPHTKGGFKTSQYGTVTCYATSTSAHALIAARDTIAQYFSPGEIWSIVARHRGGYSADARTFQLGRRRGRPVELALNQGTVLLWIASLALSWAALILALPEPSRATAEDVRINLAAVVLGVLLSALITLLIAIRRPNLGFDILVSLGVAVFPLAFASLKFAL